MEIISGCLYVLIPFLFYNDTTMRTSKLNRFCIYPINSLDKASVTKQMAESAANRMEDYFSRMTI